MKCPEITVKCHALANDGNDALDRAANRYDCFRGLGAHLHEEFRPLLAFVLD